MWLSFFFSSRRRHTRWTGDWSSDVCSSDLGEYLVNEVAHCSHCHSPRGDKGQPDRARLLQGATLPIRPKEPTTDWADKSPDITKSGLAGMWSEADMVKFLTTGKNPEGEGPKPPMPVFRLHEEDARAVTA